MRFIIFLIFGLLLLVLNACKSKQETIDTDTGEFTSVAQQPSHAPVAIDQATIPYEDRKPHEDAYKPAQKQDLVQRMNDFSFNLFKGISKETPAENLAFSPASLNMAMAVVFSGAEGTTRDQIGNTFGFDIDPDVFHTNYLAYLREIKDLGDDTLVEFNLANRVFLEQSYDVTRNFMHNVATYHDGAFERLDFIAQTRLAEQRINEWVEEQTRERIRDIIPEGSLDDLTRLVLVNALYIKSDWKYPFDKYATHEKEFTNALGIISMKDFMRQRQDRILWYEEEAFIAIDLPYSSPEFSLLLIRPNASSVADISKYIPYAETYKRILDNLRYQDVIMEIPSFKTESTFNLTNRLRNVGLENAFDQRADFSGISGQRDLHISNVLQKVFFEIDEEGSEAAAATAITIVTTSAPAFPDEIEPKHFIADRPFVFILKENRFHTPLFIGQYVK